MLGEVTYLEPVEQLLWEYQLGTLLRLEQHELVYVDLRSLSAGLQRRELTYYRYLGHAKRIKSSLSAR